TVPMLYQRLRGWPHGATVRDSEGKPVFTLGRWGVPINAAAVLYGGAMVINLAWPRAEIYDPTGQSPLLQWAGPITIAGVVLAGIACFPRRAHPRPVTAVLPNLPATKGI
ncbi:hypothetical protein ACFQ30_19965, partial [Devosia equisanguinis]|uniref:hypothetical protein n=1 Tax=Devosia equisanguinis TaxID=2490941 RepID=UPI00363899BD